MNGALGATVDETEMHPMKFYSSGMRKVPQLPEREEGGKGASAKCKESETQWFLNSRTEN